MNEIKTANHGTAEGSLIMFEKWDVLESLFPGKRGNPID